MNCGVFLVSAVSASAKSLRGPGEVLLDPFGGNMGSQRLIGGVKESVSFFL